MIRFYEDDFSLDEITTDKYITAIRMRDIDTFTAAVAATTDKPPCCLNFASHKRPGGGYLSIIDTRMPIKTQEEDLFRRSNLPEIMDRDVIRAFYPLTGFQGFYCSNVIVNKDQRCDPVTPFKVSVITVPAVVNPRLEQMGLVEGRAKRILEIAVDNKEEILILGAWGCGVFHNDPNHIANLFVRMLRNEFRGVFKEVVFAIPGKDSENYKIFEAAL